jgi:hypothetical protein
MSKTAKGTELLGRGAHLLDSAVDATEAVGPNEEGATAIADAVLVLRSAMNWLEDTDQFEVAHRLLDEAGAYRRAHYPEQCLLEFADEGYAVTCPVSLAHNRVGLSVGYIVRNAECSICRQDPEDCEHRVGVTYDGELCHRVITKADLLEVSLVGRPAVPDARIERIGIPSSELQDELGDAFRP